MTRVWKAVLRFWAGLMQWLARRRMPANGGQRVAALDVGASVFVRRPDGKRLAARVLSCEESDFFWIELEPGDARWCVPGALLEPRSSTRRREG